MIGSRPDLSGSLILLIAVLVGAFALRALIVRRERKPSRTAARLQGLPDAQKLVILVLLSLPALLPWAFAYYVPGKLGDVDWPDWLFPIVVFAVFVLPVALPLIAIRVAIVLRGPKVTTIAVVLFNLIGMFVMLRSCAVG